MKKRELRKKRGFDPVFDEIKYGGGCRYRRYFYSDGEESFHQLDRFYTSTDKNHTEIKVGDKVNYKLCNSSTLKGIGVVIDLFHSPPKIFVRCDLDNDNPLNDRIVEMEWDEIEKIEETNKKSPMYDVVLEENHTEEYLGSYSSIQDIKWIKESVSDLSNEQIKDIEYGLINENQVFHTRGQFSGLITVVVYDRETNLFDWYSHIPNEKPTHFGDIKLKHIGVS